jgi:hypothetical protein
MEDADDNNDGCGWPQRCVTTAEDTTINHIGDGEVKEGCAAVQWVEAV